jgi:uncharacterized protein YegP (UPF0339 family)
MTPKFELYKDTTSGNYWFLLKAGNGEPVAESQVYRSITDARAGMAAVQRAAAAAGIPDSDDVVDVQSGNYIHMHYKATPH